jgi:hypothetical protein
MVLYFLPLKFGLQLVAGQEEGSLVVGFAPFKPLDGPDGTAFP